MLYFEDIRLNIEHQSREYVIEKEEIIAVGCFLIFEEQRFDLY